MGPPTDAELIDASISCPERFAGIFDRHAPTLLRYCTRRVGPHDAEDVLAETFRVAFTTRDRYDPTRASALPWLYGIAANLIRKQHRSTFRGDRALARSCIGADTAATLVRRIAARTSVDNGGTVIDLGAPDVVDISTVYIPDAECTTVTVTVGGNVSVTLAGPGRPSGPDDN